MRALWLACLAIFAFALPLAAQDASPEDPDRDVGLITDFVEKRLSGVSREIRIEGFDGALSSRATIESLTIADREGVWLRLEDLVLDWNRSALLRGRVQVQELTAGRIALLRQPLPDPTAPSAGSNPLRIPELPVSVSIGALQAEQIEVSADFLGEPLVAQLWGDAELADGSLSASFNALRVDGQGGQFTLNLDFDKPAGHLSLALIADEAQNGIAAKALNLPGHPSLRLAVFGFGPVEDFSASVALETDNTPRLSGAINLAQSEGAPTRVGVDLSGDLSALFAPEYGAFFGDQSRLTARAVTPPEGGLRVDDLMLDTAGLDLSGNLLIAADGWPERFALTGQIEPVPGGVLLPLSGPRTTLGQMDLALDYDSAKSSDWTAHLTLRDLKRQGLSVPLAQLTGGGIITPAGSHNRRWNIDLAYGAHGIELTNAGLSEALGAAITGAIIANGAASRPTRISEISLTGPGLEALASGHIQGRAGGFATHLETRFEGRDLGRFSGLAGRALNGAAALNVTLDLHPVNATTALTITGETSDIAIGDPRIDPLLAGPGLIEIRAERDPDGTRIPLLDIHTDHARIEADANLGYDMSTARLTALIPEAALLSPDLAGEARITASFAQGADEVSHLDLVADLPGASAQGKARIQPKDQDYATWINGQIDASRLDLYADLLGRDIGGAANLNIIGNLEPLAETFGIALSGQTHDLQLGEARLDPLLAGPGFLSVAALRSTDGRLSISGLDLSTQELSATGSGSIKGAAITADFDARLRDFAVLSPDLSGPMRITGTAAQTERGGTKADVVASAPGLDLKVQATVAPPSEDPGRSLATRFNIDVTARDLGRYSGLAGRDLAGGLSGTLRGTAAPETQRFDARIDAEISDLALGLPQLDPLLQGAGHLRGRAARRQDGAMIIEGLDAQTPHLRASGDLSIAPGDVSADLDARLEDLAMLVPDLPGPVDLSVVSEPAPGGTKLRLDGRAPGMAISGTAVVDDSDATLPARLSITATVPRLERLRGLAGLPLSGSARIEATARGQIAQATGTADISAYTTDLAIGSEQADALLRGGGQIRGQATRDTNGALRLSGITATFPHLRAGGDAVMQNGAIEAGFSLMLPELARVVPQLSGRLTAVGQARLADGSTQIDVTASGDSGLSARVQGALNNGQADLDITGSVPLAVANGAISPQTMSGRALLDLQLRGAPGVDALSGTVQIADGRLSEPDSGQSFEQIAGTVTLHGADARLDMTAAPSAGGQLDLQGSVRLEDQFPADLTLNARSVVLRDPGLYETTANGQLRLQGPAQNGALVSGRIDLGETELRVPSAGAAMLGQMPEIRHQGAADQVTQTLTRAGLSIAGIDIRRGGSASSGSGARPGISFPLDLTISAPSRIFLRGRGLDAELGGALTLRGTNLAPIPAGRFELIRGRIDILQQRFTLTEGFATIEGDFSPWLYLMATTETADGGSASIIVEGDVSEPEIRFESVPPLPQDEVLSRLIFGRDLSAISPLQAVQLAAAVNTLIGRGDGGLMVRLRDHAGLDDLDITSDDEGRTAVTAGKYLSEDVYTNVTVASDGTSRIDLNLDLTDDLTLRGGTDTGGDSSVGIFFERDY